MKVDKFKQEDCELDANSTFNKLKKLQQALKEEVSLKDIFNLNKEEIMKEIDLLSFNYYKRVVKIKEIFNFNTQFMQDRSTALFPMRYELTENSQNELPQCYEPLYKFVYYFHDHFDVMLDLIDHCDKRQYDDLAHLVCHGFYQNIFTSTAVPERLLLLIYFLLEKEVDKLSEQSSSLSFLDVTFLSRLIKSMTRKEDIKSYLSTILSKLILTMDNDEDKYICMDPSKIRDNLAEYNENKEKSEYAGFERYKTVTIDDPLHYLIDDIRVSRTTQLNKMNIEEQQSLNFVDEELKNNPYLDINTDLIELQSTEVNPKYKIDISQDYIMNQAKEETDDNMQLFYLKQIAEFENDVMILTNKKFIEDLKTYMPSASTILAIYKTSFNKIKIFIDELISNLIENIFSIPYPIKCICLIIERLIIFKFPEINNIEKNAFLGKFFFEELIIPILYNPIYNGMFTTSIISDKTRDNMVIISKIIKKLYRGNLFNSEKENESTMTIFNTFFIELMPSLLKFFQHLTETVLPESVEEILIKKEMGNSDISEMTYNYFDEFKNENMEHQAICLTWSDFFLFFNTVKENEAIFIPDLNTMFAKTFKKLTFHVNSLRNKMKQGEKAHKQTYILINKICYSKEYERKIEEIGKEEMFSFESTDENADEKFILARVKYCISVILRNLNILTRANFFIDDSESTENFVIGLNKLIELEGFGDSLKDNCIPLDWFGLYLQSNIENIPVEYKRNNYSQVYEELLNNACVTLKNKENDELLNYFYLKTQNCKRLIEIIDKTHEELRHIEKLIDVYRFVQSMILPVIIKIVYDKTGIARIKISEYQPNKINFHFFAKYKCTRKLCNNIPEFIEKFPVLTENVLESLDYQEKIKVNKILEIYYEIIKKKIQNDSLFSRYTDNEKIAINIDIENYIQKKLYSKLDNKMPSINDVELYRKTIQYEWVQPKHLISNLDVFNAQLISVANKYLNYMYTVRSPIDKLNAFRNVYLLIQNTISFYTGIDEVKEEDCIDLLVYITLKYQPPKLCSNVKYIELYISKYQRRDIDISKLQKIRQKIHNLTKDNLKCKEDIPK